MAGRANLEPPPQGTALAVGTFDGVHLGHRALIASARAAAAERGASSAVLTWDRHPMATLRPHRVPELLSSAQRKAELIADTGVDALAVLAFDDAFAQLSPEAFVEEVLVGSLAVKTVHVGEGWRFGHRAAGTVDLLRTMGERFGFEVAPAELVVVGNEPVSSSRTRRAVAAGDLQEARALLGRPHDVDGEVVRGAARGKTLGFPTANLDVDPALARPPLGVYAGLAHVEEGTFAAAVNVGVNPTFGGRRGVSPVTIEAYLLDVELDLYGRTLRLEFWERLRDELRFESVDELVRQIERDVEATRAVVKA